MPISSVLCVAHCFARRKVVLIQVVLVRRRNTFNFLRVNFSSNSVYENLHTCKTNIVLKILQSSLTISSLWILVYCTMHTPTLKKQLDVQVKKSCNASVAIKVVGYTQIISFGTFLLSTNCELTLQRLQLLLQYYKHKN